MHILSCGPESSLQFIIISTGQSKEKQDTDRIISLVALQLLQANINQNV